jgi:hypothetical protein
MCCLGLLGCSDAPTLDDLDELYSEIVELAGDGSCDELSECATLAVGSKACGGPSSYIVYCASAIDEAALIEKVDEYTQLEQDYNLANDIVSTCEDEPEPDVELVDGVCTPIGF